MLVISIKPHTVLLYIKKNPIQKFKKLFYLKIAKEESGKVIFLTRKSSFIIFAVWTYFLTGMEQITSNILFYSISNKNLMSLSIMKFNTSYKNKHHYMLQSNNKVLLQWRKKVFRIVREIRRQCQSICF